MINMHWYGPAGVKLLDFLAVTPTVPENICCQKWGADRIPCNPPVGVYNEKKNYTFGPSNLVITKFLFLSLRLKQVHLGSLCWKSHCDASHPPCHFKVWDIDGKMLHYACNTGRVTT